MINRRGSPRHSFNSVGVKMQKRCTKCRKEKPLTDFGKRGWRYHCAACRSKNKHIQHDEKQEFIKRNPRPPLNEKFICTVCKKPLWPESNRNVVLDHDHKTGNIRGWLCVQCNVGIGQLSDDISILQRAINWVKNNGPK